MLEIRLLCENCGKKLSHDSTEALICSFECTFCSDCVENILENVCPNCGGGFEKRPIRPKEKLLIYPASTKKTLKPVDFTKFESLQLKNKNIKPNER